MTCCTTVVVSGRVRTKNLKSGEKIKTVDGGELTVLINPISASIFVYSGGTDPVELGEYRELK